MTLIGFEKSQTITAALREIGIEAYSCDIQHTTGNKKWHIHDDIFNIITHNWEKIILHPPCTYTALSGNRWYANTKEREEGIELCKNIWNISINKCNFVALEQPMTVMQKYIGKRTQTIQPWMFGHGETKETWLWLKGFERLIPTNVVEGREQRIWKMSNKKDRGEIRSITYPGIAQAIANQWFNT